MRSLWLRSMPQAGEDWWQEVENVSDMILPCYNEDRGTDVAGNLQREGPTAAEGSPPPKSSVAPSPSSSIVTQDPFRTSA